MSVSSNVEPLASSHSITRRRLLQAGGMGMLSLGLPGLVAARVDGTAGRPAGAREKSCIFILLCGGPSHLDTWDLKPDAPAEIRGPYHPIATAVPGMRISELHTRLAKLTRHFTLIRSMSHPGNISNHFDAMHNSLSGAAGAPADSPYLGSVLAKIRPSQRNVASYVWLIKCVGDPVFCAPNIGTGGILGAPYAPLFVGAADNHPAMPGFKPPDVFASTDTSEERIQARRRLLDNLDPAEMSNEGQRVTREWQDLHRQAFDLATAREAKQAFNLERESPIVRDRYGRHALGQNLLLARRLVESGVGFVTVNGWTGPSPGQQGGGPPSSSWDMHGGEMGMGNAFGTGSYGMGWCLPRLDEALSALLNDLHDRGLLDSTLVVVAGEFGRTPRINQLSGATPGRQHWPACYSAILAGAGIRGGTVYGASDKIGAYVKDRPVRPQDLGATIYHALGVPLDRKLSKDGVSRPVTTGQPLLDLFA
ncbi:MAG: DUF1501 domain-containing protein [Gemmataceae bacterium]|nr:DUF1501 domain-containing protein [Gemmataceae bacterium]